MLLKTTTMLVILVSVELETKRSWMTEHMFRSNNEMITRSTFLLSIKSSFIRKLCCLFPITQRFRAALWMFDWYCSIRELRCLRHKIHMGLFLTFLLADLSWIFTALIQVEEIAYLRKWTTLCLKQLTFSCLGSSLLALVAEWLPL